MTRTSIKLKVLESPMVESFYEPRRTFWHMFQILSVAGFRGEIFLKTPKSAIFIGGTLSKKYFSRKIRKFWIFYFPKTCFNTNAMECLFFILHRFIMIEWFLVRKGHFCDILTLFLGLLVPRIWPCASLWSSGYGRRRRSNTATGAEERVW